MMTPEVTAALQKQLNHERQNAQKYFYVASIFANMALDGFAKFFTKQGQGELEHADWISEFLISKRIQPIYAPLEGVSVPMDVVELAKFALVTELQTTQALSDIYALCEEDGNYQACALMDKMLLEQIEEENVATDFVDQVNRTKDWTLLDDIYGKK